MGHLRVIEGGRRRAGGDEIDRVVDSEIEPLIEVVQTAAENGDLPVIRCYSGLLVQAVNRLLDDVPALDSQSMQRP